MSLEARIELLTAAVIELTAAIGAMQAPNPVTATLEDIQPKAVALPAEVAQELKETKKPAAAQTPKASAAQVVTEAEQQSSDTTSGEQSQPTGESSSPELTYNDHVKPATLKLSQKMGREVAIAVLGRFGVKGAQNLDASQWADYIAHCESVMNGGEV